MDSGQCQIIITLKKGQEWQASVIIIILFICAALALGINFERPKYSLDAALGHQAVARIAVGKSIAEALNSGKTVTWEDTNLKLNVRIKPRRVFQHKGEVCGVYHIRIIHKKQMKNWEDKHCKKPNQNW